MKLLSSFLIIFFLHQYDALEIECDHEGLVQYQSCDVKSFKASSPSDKTVTRINANGSEILDTNNEVLTIGIYDQNLEFFPTGFTKLFPKITEIYLVNLSIKELTKNDLKEFGRNLKNFYVQNTKISHLTHDLFEFNPFIEYIQIADNKIQSVEYGTLDNLPLIRFYFNEECAGEEIYVIPEDSPKIKEILPMVYERCSI